MRVGDKKQAAVLSGVAVLALGFLVFQLVPKGSPRPSAPPPASVSPATVQGGGPTVSLASMPGTSVPVMQPSKDTETETAALAPRRLKRDPFAELQKAATPEPIASAPAPPVIAPAPTLSGVLPPAALAPEFTPPAPTKTEPAPAPKPKPPASKPATQPPATQPAAKPRLTLRVLGVVEGGGGKPNVAMVRLGERETTLRPGDAVGPGLRVAAVTLEGITFRDRPGGPLAPGDEILL